MSLKLEEVLNEEEKQDSSEEFSNIEKIYVKRFS